MDSTLSQDRTSRIALLNDALRMTFHGGTVCITAGLHLLGEQVVIEALRKVQAYSSFDADNDPYGEHDFGDVLVGGRCLLWKIDYFDRAVLFGSEDPSDPQRTHRVLTVMLEEEY